MLPCPLCQKNSTESFFKKKEREYRLCQSCDLVSVPEIFHLSAHEEKARYDTHENSVDDIEYRRFLSTLFNPLERLLLAGAKGLDFGSGPGPALAAMWKEAGYKIDTFDPFYSPNYTVLEKTYDFVSCTETVEHFRKPKESYDQLSSLLKPDAWLGIMTQMPKDWTQFESWYYHNDPTHLMFYSHKTMKWIANHYDWQYRFPHTNVVLFKNHK